MVRFALVLLVACSGAGGRGSTPSTSLQPGDIAITNVSVLPMSPDGVLEHHTVVVRGDRIVAVGPTASIAVPAGALAIDGGNRWLMPGLADMHVHLWNEGDLTLFVAAGVTTIRNMFGAEQHVAWRSEIARGQRLGPTIVTAGPIIDGEPPVWPGSTTLVDPADADRIVADQKARGYDFLKPYSRLSREAYEALAAAAARHGMALAGHAPIAVGLGGTLGAKQRSIEHLDGYLAGLVREGVALPDGMQARMRAVLSNLDEARLPGVVAQTVAAGTWNCPTLIVYDRIAALEDMGALRQRVKWLDKVAPAVVSRWDPSQDFRFRAYTADDFAAIRTGNQWRARIVSALAAAGAPLLVGTDTGNPFVVAGAALHDEIELMIAAGVPRRQVLRAATAGAAEYLGAHDAGVIKVGARADLVLVAGDPFAEPLPLVPDGVMVRGRWLARAELEARLAEIARRAAAPAPDRWQGVAPLAPEGKVVHQAHYDLSTGGTAIGEERLAVGVVDGARVVVSQMVAELAGPVQTAYRIGPGAASLRVASSAGVVEVAGKVSGGAFVVTGSASGKPVSLTAPFPAGALLGGPGAGGTILLADRLAGLKVGDRRALVSLEITFFPAVGLATTSHEVERKPDVDGRRVYALVSTAGGHAERSDVLVDVDGFVVKHAIGAPMNLTFTRR